MINIKIRQRNNVRNAVQLQDETFFFLNFKQIWEYPDSLWKMSPLWAIKDKTILLKLLRHWSGYIVRPFPVQSFKINERMNNNNDKKNPQKK